MSLIEVQVECCVETIDIDAKVIEQAPAAARSNREALEKIELCAALADAKRTEVAEYFGPI